MFSQAHLKTTLKTKTFEKSISFDFIEFRILRYVLHCSVFFGARLENPKINKRRGPTGGPNNSGRGGGAGVGLFFKKNKQGGLFIQDLREVTINNYKCEPKICDGCHDILMLVYKLENIAILNIKGIDYRCFIWNMTKKDAINRLSNSKLDGKSSL